MPLCVLGLANLVIVDKGNLSLVSVEDLGNLLESRPLGLDVEEGNEEEFDEDPDLIMISTGECAYRDSQKLTA